MCYQTTVVICKKSHKGCLNYYRMPCDPQLQSVDVAILSHTSKDNFQTELLKKPIISERIHNIQCKMGISIYSCLHVSQKWMLKRPKKRFPVYLLHSMIMMFSLTSLFEFDRENVFRLRSTNFNDIIPL